jgi:hypothetical protein
MRNFSVCWLAERRSEDSARPRLLHKSNDSEVRWISAGQLIYTHNAANESHGAAAGFFLLVLTSPAPGSTIRSNHFSKEGVAAA